MYELNATLGVVALLVIIAGVLAYLEFRAGESLRKEIEEAVKQRGVSCLSLSFRALQALESRLAIAGLLSSCTPLRR